MSPRSRRRGGGQSRNRRRQGGRGNQHVGGAGFFGDPSKLPEVPLDIRVTEDPAAVARSLGPPPLPGHELVAEAYFAAVYDRAVTLAGALATAAGITPPEEPSDTPVAQP